MFGKIKIQGKDKIVFNNILGAFFVKGGALVVSFLTLPAYINYFKDDLILGFWFTMLSILSWILNFDLGIGNGLRNYLAEAIANNDDKKSKEHISSAYISVGSILIIISLVAYVLFKYIDWNNVFSISKDIIPEQTLLKVVLLTFIGILIQFFLNIITSILYAIQKSAFVNILMLVTNTLILLYVLIPNSNNIETKLINLSFYRIFAVNIPFIIATIIIFIKPLKKSIPNFRYFNFRYAKNILRLGTNFLLLQLFFMVLTTFSPFLISKLTVPSDVVEYNIYLKLFYLISSIFVIALTPMWSMFTKAYAENDINWIKRIYKKFIILASIATGLEFALILILQPILNVWLNDNSITVNYSYAIVFAILGCLYIWNGLFSSLSNGINNLKIQRLCFLLGVIIFVPLSYLFVHLTESWIGVVIANCISLSLYSIVQPFYIKRIFYKQEKNVLVK